MELDSHTYGNCLEERRSMELDGCTHGDCLEKHRSMGWSCRYGHSWVGGLGKLERSPGFCDRWVGSSGNLEWDCATSCGRMAKRRSLERVCADRSTQVEAC
jgi:hypothetical protein